MPDYHDEIEKEHRREWPSLWKAIDALLAATPQGPTPAFTGEPRRMTTVDKLERAIRALADALDADPFIGKTIDFPQVVENALRADRIERSIGK